MSRFRTIYNIPARYLVLLSFIGYVLLAFSFPLLPNYDRQPVGDIRTFAPGMAGGFLYGLLLLVQFALYWLMYRRILGNPVTSLKHVLGAACLLAFPLFFTYPINANDVYRYVIRGLISSRYGVSPFEYAPVDFGESLYPLLAGEWFDVTSPYGPFWELTASFVTSFGQDDFLTNILIFKMIGFLSFVGAGVILWMLFPIYTHNGYVGDNRRLAFTILWVLNPALLFSFVGNAHNDSMMIMILLSGWLTVSSGYRGPGFLLMLAAALIKPIALLAAPIAFVSSWRNLENGRSRIVFALWVFVGGIALVYLAFLPFGNPASLTMRLLQEASAGASFSPLTLVILLDRELGWSVSFSVIAQIATFVFVIFSIWLIWRTWRGKSAEQSMAMVFWGYILQALNFRIWYAIWPFPWLLLDAFGGERLATRRLHAGLWFLLTSQLSVIIYGHFRVAFLGGSHLFAHIIGVPFVFLLPLVLAWFTSPGQDSDGYENHYPAAL